MKGVPPGTRAFPLDALPARGWRAMQDLSPPFALLRRSALDHNRAFVRRLLRATGALYAPHGKTTMSPELFREQLEDGAWGITLATASQVVAARGFGVSRILLANEIVDPHALRWLAEERRRDPAFELLGYVDSEAGVELWGEAMRGIERPLLLLLEVGYAGGRSGCRDIETARGVAEAVARTPGLALAGVSGFEGLIRRATDRETDADVAAFVATIAATARALHAAGLFDTPEILLSAGGSAFYDLVAGGLSGPRLELPARLVLRSGCLVSHDEGIYARAFEGVRRRFPDVDTWGESPRPALELWAHVLARPEPLRVVAGLGKRDAAHDAGLPQPRLWFRPGTHAAPQPLAGAVTAALNDQHALLDVDAGGPLRPGDLVGFGISHPCLTFDRWRLLFVVDDDDRVLGGVRTFF